VLFAFWAKDQALQRRVFFLLGYKLFLKPLNGGSLFYDNFLSATTSSGSFSRTLTMRSV